MQWVSLCTKTSRPKKLAPPRNSRPPIPLLRHRHHLILPPTTTTFRPPTPSKANRPQLPPPTAPHAPDRHQRRARTHERPPQPVRGQTARVQRRYEQVDGVEGEREVRD